MPKYCPICGKTLWIESQELELDPKKQYSGYCLGKPLHRWRLEGSTLKRIRGKKASVQLNENT